MISPINHYYLENKHSRGEIINCFSGDQCLWEEVRGKKKSHCSCSVFPLFKADPQLPIWRMETILEWPFGIWHHGGLGAWGCQVWEGGCPQRSLDRAPRGLCSAYKERRRHKSAHLRFNALPQHPSQPLLPDKKDGPRGVRRYRVEGVHIP